MELTKKNYFNTTTQLNVQSNTSGSDNLLNRDIRYQYVSSGYNNDLTTTRITISFDTTQTISRIALLEMNWKDFTIYKNGSTASTFSMTSTSDTMASDYTSNSETSKYFYVTPAACTSVSFDVLSTQTTNAEKAIGYILLTDVELDFDRIPSAANYKPLLDPKQVVHELSDGGVRIQTIQEKQSAEIKFNYISTSFRNNLKEVYDKHTEFFFVPFGTTTSWDKIIFECVWPGNFEFFRFSDNAATAGFGGTIKLSETPI